MKKKNILYILIAILLPMSYTIFSSNSNGTFSTGNSTSGCSCHGPNLSTTSISLANNIPSGGYVGGTTYNLTLSVSNAAFTMANARAGFDLTCSEGTITAGAGTTLVGTTELVHTSPKALVSGATSWTFNWTAPVGGSGAMVFNVAANATNGNNATSGDQPNRDPFPFVEATTSSAPTITNVTKSGITGTTCTIGASINANGASTAANVEYGTTTSYGNNTALSPTPITGTTPTSATGNITSLLPNTLYHYRVNAINAAGTTNGTDDTFRTGAPNSVQYFDKKEYALYPNPASTFVFVRINESIRSFKIQLFSLNGMKVGTPQAGMAGEDLKVDLSAYSSGNYFMEAYINERRLVEKIRIQ